MTESVYITNAGRNAIVDAQYYGYKIDLVRFKVSDTVVPSTDPVVVAQYTEIPGNIVYDSGNNPTNNTLRYHKVDYSITVSVYLHSDIGPFMFGTIGLYLSDGTLFAILALSQLFEKTTNQGNIAGNNYDNYFRFDIEEASVINTEVLVESFADLPFVLTETGLPLPNLAPHGNYFIQNFRGTGKSAIACTNQTEWNYLVSSLNGTHENWVENLDPTFLTYADLTVWKYNATSNTWVLADNLDTFNVVGVKDGSGIRLFGAISRPGQFTPDTDYYLGTGSSAGSLISLSSYWYIGHSISADTLLVNPKYIDNNLYVPNIPSFYQSTNNSTTIILSLPDVGIYPETYFTGLEVSFLCPFETPANVSLQITGLDAKPIVRYNPVTGSTSRLDANEINVGTLIRCTYIDGDDLNGAWRIDGGTLLDKVSRGGDTMTGTLSLPELDYIKATDNSQNIITKLSDSGDPENKLLMYQVNNPSNQLQFVPVSGVIRAAGTPSLNNDLVNLGFLKSITGNLGTQITKNSDFTLQLSDIGHPLALTTGVSNVTLPSFGSSYSGATFVAINQTSNVINILPGAGITNTSLYRPTLSPGYYCIYFHDGGPAWKTISYGNVSSSNLISVRCATNSGTFGWDGNLPPSNWGQIVVTPSNLYELNGPYSLAQLCNGSRFTAPVDGVYSIYASITARYSSGTAPSYFNMFSYKYGSVSGPLIQQTVPLVTLSSSLNMAIGSVSAATNLQAGDVISLEMYVQPSNSSLFQCTSYPTSNSNASNVFAIQQLA